MMEVNMPRAKKIPPPKRGRSSKYPFYDMKKGDMVTVEGVAAVIRCAVAVCARKTKYKFTTREMMTGKVPTMDVWRTA
jgi:hypothetical protein